MSDRGLQIKAKRGRIQQKLTRVGNKNTNGNESGTVEFDNKTTTDKIIFGNVGLYWLIYSFLGPKAIEELPCVCKVFNSHLVDYASKILYFQNVPEMKTLALQLKASTRLALPFDFPTKIDRAACHRLASQSICPPIGSILALYKNMTHLALSDIFPHSLASLKSSPPVAQSIPSTKLNTFWISYCIEENHRTLLACSMPKNTTISLDFLHCLLGFSQDISRSHLDILVKFPEFRHMRYFCLSLEELRVLKIQGEQYADIIPYIADCKKIQGLHLPFASITDNCFFDKWPHLIELRIFSFQVHKLCVFDFSTLECLRVLHLSIVYCQTPIEIRNRTLIDLKLEYENSVDIPLAIIGDECTSLERLALMTSGLKTLVVQLPKQSDSIKAISLGRNVFVEDLEDYLASYPNLESLYFLDAVNIDFKSFPPNLSRLEHLHFRGISIENIILPDEMLSLKKLIIDCELLRQIQLPMSAPELCSIEYSDFNAFRTEQFAGRSFPKLTYLFLKKCAIQDAFVLPGHFPALSVIMFYLCNLGDIILPLPRQNDISMHFLNCRTVQLVYDYAGGRDHDVDLTVDRCRYPFVTVSSNKFPELANMGAVFSLEKVHNVEDRLLTYAIQKLYFDPTKEAIRPIKLPEPLPTLPPDLYSIINWCTVL